jgi:hypothetical protein
MFLTIYILFGHDLFLHLDWSHINLSDYLNDASRSCSASLLLIMIMFRHVPNQCDSYDCCVNVINLSINIVMSVKNYDCELTSW